MASAKRLSDKQVAALKWSGRTSASGKPVADVHPDGNGLVLSITPSAKSWILRIFIDGKERRVGLGGYPEIGLKKAREKAEAERVAARSTGQTQADRKRAEREAQAQAAAAAERAKVSTFEAAARAWHEAEERRLTKKHAAQLLATLEQHAFPAIGAMELSAIRPAHILDNVLGPMLHRKDPDTGEQLPPLVETASRVFQRIGAVFAYANLRDLCETNPVPACKREFVSAKKQVAKSRPKEHHPALLEPKAIGAMLRDVAAYPSASTRLALQFIAYTAVRSGELRGATWGEFTLDGEEPTWIIPAERMKARREHVVPLSTQAVATLGELKKLAADNDLVVPGRGGERPVSDMTLSMALRRLGYEDRQSVHGFRSIFSTLMREQSNFRPAAIEAQLAHAVKDATEAAYSRGQYLEERRKMMQAFADLLDRLRDGAGDNVVEFKKA